MSEHLKHDGETKLEYLGDGLYASFDGWQVWLRASDGMRVTNEVALEPSVMEALNKYVDRLHAPKTSGFDATVANLESDS